MRVLMIHNEYAKPSGEEHASQAIADLLTQHGHEVDWHRRSSAEIAGSVAGRAKALFTGIYNPCSRRRVKRVLTERDYDVVQVQNLYPLLSPAILGPVRRAGVPLVMRCPNYRVFCPNGLHLVKAQVCERCLGFGREAWCILRNCERSPLKSTGYAIRNAVARVSGMIVRNVNVFIVQSEFQKGRFAAGGIEPDRMVVVSGVTPRSAEDEPPGTGRTISFVGRLSEEKGITDFIDAARELPDLEFAVAGDTAGADALVAAAPPNVRFAGFVSGADLETFYRETKVFVCPSKWYEGFPNVITRAMVAGKPVVTSRIGALPEIVDDGETGLVFTPGDVNELVDRIRRLAGDAAMCRALGAAGREKAARLYCEDAVYRKLEQAYARAGELARAGRVAVAQEHKG